MRIGAPQIAKTASPMYLISVPPVSNSVRVISEKYALSIVAVSVAVIFSAIAVKPLISVNSAVPTISSPPRLRDSGLSLIFRIISGER